MPMTRNEKIVRLKRAGTRTGFLAKHYGISRGRIAQIVKAADKRDAVAQKPGAALSTRARNVLYSELYDVAPLPTAFDVTPQIVARLISKRQLLEAPNCGIVTAYEIKDWLREHGLLLRY